MKRVSESVRLVVKQRAQGRCEYCRFPQSLSTFGFQVDHIIAVKHGGTNETDNLAWACFRCNNLKGSDPGSYDEQTKQLTPFFNPRTQTWDDHFEIVDGFIRGKTATGRVTVQIFQMNHPKLVEMRQVLVKAGLW